MCRFINPQTGSLSNVIVLNFRIRVIVEQNLDFAKNDVALEAEPSGVIFKGRHDIQHDDTL
jgi:hypothetical protein